MALIISKQIAIEHLLRAMHCSWHMAHPHGVTECWTQLSSFTFTFHFHALEKEMATLSSVLSWRIPGTTEPGGLLSMGSHRVRNDWNDLAAGAAWSYFQQMATHINILRQLFRNVIRCEYYEAKKKVKPEMGVKGRHGEGESWEVALG